MAAISSVKISMFRVFRKPVSINVTNCLKRRYVSTSIVERAEEKSSKIDTDAQPVKSDADTSQGGAVIDPQAVQISKNTGPFKRIKDAHDQVVRESGGPIIVPNNLDKVALLWSGKYASPEDIPPLISAKVQARADDKMRVVMCIWIMTTVTFAFLTMIKLGQRRLKMSHAMVTERQNQIWASRAKAGTSQQVDLSR